MDNSVAGKIEATSDKQLAVQKSLVRTFVVALTMVFLGELGIMRVLAFFPDLPASTAAFLDGVFLAALLLPLWFFLSHRPMREKTEECDQERQKVLKQNAFLHTVLDALPFPFYVIDAKDYRVQIINKAAGINVAGDLTCHALSHKSATPCSGGEHPCPMLEVKRTGKPVILEHLHYNQHGAQRVMEVHGYPIFDEAGNIVQMIESSMDITQRRLAEDALRRSEASLQDFLDNANDLIQILDLKGRFLYVNRAWQMAMGYSEKEIGSLTIHDLLHQDSRESSIGLFSTTSRISQAVGHELVFVAKNGKAIIVEGNITTQMEEGAPVAVRGIFRDITKRKQLEEQFLEQKNITEKMIKFSAVPIFVLDKNHLVTNWNKACEKMTGVKAQRVVGTSDHWRPFYPSKRSCLADLVLDGAYDSFPQFYESFDTSTFLHDGVRSEGWFDNVGGKDRYIIFDAVPIYNRAKELVAVIETLQDISERKKLGEKLEQLATTDALTGLYNRHRFNELLEQEVARARRYHTPLSLIMFDLDYFKNINDTYGHAVGDQVLQEVAKVIRENVRATDWVGRWGGEEFLVLCPEATEKDAVATAEKLRGLVESHIFETVETITISCGVTRFKAPDSIDAFVSRADDGLYRAKDKGRNIVEIV
ncbi:MAG: diguanylate cyclase [Deltaproteobacteria bacterium]|nr:diguanylate cyclase [Deltaproteobacteria bacterium]